MKPTQILRLFVLGALFAARSAHASPPVGSDAWWGDRLSAASATPLPKFAPVENIEQLGAIVASLERATARPITIYANALVSPASRETRLVAAYQLGATHLAIVTRARAAIILPPDFATNPEAANHWLALHRALEPMLAVHLRDAIAAFQQAQDIVDEIPAGVPADEVVRSLVPLIRELLETIQVS